MYPTLSLTSEIQIPTYYLVLSFTVCLGLLWSVRRADHLDLSRSTTLDIGLIIMVAGFFGGRLFHVLYEDFPYYREQPLRVLEFWNGGFVFYGGALLAAFLGFIYLRKKAPTQIGAYLDLLAPVMALCYAVGRIACLLAGCCYGRFCDLPWAIAERHPTQLYASLWEAGVLLILLGLEKGRELPKSENLFQRTGSIFYTWISLHALGRLLMEHFREDFRGPQWGLSISSWISVGVLTLGLYLLFKKPGSKFFE